MTWSEQQERIFRSFREERGNLIVRARAGTGKTTTCVEALTHAVGRFDSALVCAFNVEAKDTLASRITTPRVDVKTLNGIGHKFLAYRWQGSKPDPSGSKGWKSAEVACGTFTSTKIRDEIVPLVRKLAELGKGAAPLATSGADLRDLALDFECYPDESFEDLGWTIERVCTAAYKAMELALVQSAVFDFSDQIFVPLRLKMVRAWYDLVVVDEAQDMNMAQLLLAQGVCKRTGRIVVVGDDRQAIYGFRGADSDSLDRLKRELRAGELGLTITYRCARKIVDVARKYVPDYQAAPDALDGIVRDLNLKALPTEVRAGDFVLSRTNAPLISACLSFLRAGIRARVAGQDIGKGLIALVNKLRAKSMPDLLAKLAKWEAREATRAAASVDKADPRYETKVEARVSAITDRAETLRVLAEGMTGIPELVKRVQDLFAEARGMTDCVVCSSVHKAKGLEADRAFVLADTFRQGRGGEEDNIYYVAVTRAKRELVMVMT